MHYTLYFILLIIAFANSVDGQAQCPSGWHRIEKDCYFLSKETKNWNDANSFCSAAGGHLARIETKTENENLKSYVRSLNKVGQVWVDLTDEHNKGKWRYSSTQTPVLLTDWGKDEPSGDGNCGGFLSYHDYKWNDAPCTTSYLFMCEKTDKSDQIKVLKDELKACKKTCGHEKKVMKLQCTMNE